jgi:hypothetical protein
VPATCGFIHTLRPLHPWTPTTAGSRIPSLFTPFDPLSCQEDGCYVSVKRTIECDGHVAIIDGNVRAIARGLSPTAPRSRTRAAPIAPTRVQWRNAKPRCDGNVKLGCDDCSFVSFRDCSWNGGHCEESERGADCVDPAKDCGGKTSACEGAVFTRCVYGTPVRIDCASFGMDCANQSFDGYRTADGGSEDSAYCQENGMASPCTLSFCKAHVPADSGGGKPDAGDVLPEAGTGATN